MFAAFLMDCSVPLIALVYGLYYYSTVYDAPWEAQAYSGSLIALITGLSLLAIVRSARKHLFGSVVKVDGKVLVSIKFCKFLLSAVLFVVGIYFLGYFVSAGLLLLLTPLLLGYKRLTVPLTACAVLVFVYVVFTRLLLLQLPSGVFAR